MNKKLYPYFVTRFAASSEESSIFNKLLILYKCSVRFSSNSAASNNSVIPEKLYENADTQKLQILKENRGKSGVYRWKNKINQNSYIGSSVNLSVRLKAYYLKNQLINNMLINKALIKYGHSNFSLEILEYCDPAIAVSREQYYLDLIKPEYNILKIAGSLIGFKHSEEAKNLMASLRKGKVHSNETKAKIGAASLGRKHSQETLDKISTANKGGKTQCLVNQSLKDQEDFLK